MDYAELQRRHEERYGKILRREITLEDASREEARDQQTFRRTQLAIPGGNLSGDYMQNQRTGIWFVVEPDGSLSPVSGIVARPGAA